MTTIPNPACRVGAVLEATDFHPGRSGRDHLLMLAYAADLPASRVDEVLGLVELSKAARRRVGGYSMGMRQRLGLAGALLGDPELLILDEPANGLDPEGVHWLREFLRGFAAEGKTVFVSSHVLAEVAQTVDRVVIVNKGRLITVVAARRAACASDERRARDRTRGGPAARPAPRTRHRGRPPVDTHELVVAGATTAEVGEIAGAAGRVPARAVREHVEPRRDLPRTDCEGGVTMIRQLRSELGEAALDANEPRTPRGDGRPRPADRDRHRPCGDAGRACQGRTPESLVRARPGRRIRRRADRCHVDL